MGPRNEAVNTQLGVLTIRFFPCNTGSYGKKESTSPRAPSPSCASCGTAQRELSGGSARLDVSGSLRTHAWRGSSCWQLHQHPDESGYPNGSRRFNRITKSVAVRLGLCYFALCPARGGDFYGRFTFLKESFASWKRTVFLKRMGLFPWLSLYRLWREPESIFSDIIKRISKGPVAQLVMRRIRIAEITGSTPVRSTRC